MENKVTTQTFLQMKQTGEKIAMVTCYDYTTARILDQTGIDALLVGDSAANVMAGYSTTLPISLDEMITYAASVVRGVERAMVIVDMPFGTYQTDPKKAAKNAVKIMQRTNAQAVKLEGGEEIEDSIKAILASGIPVCGHLGLTPQSINKFGSYAVRATAQLEADKLVNDAMLLHKLGCMAIVLEKIPSKLARMITESVYIPTIGIGAGSYTDGQVLVYQDIVGLNEDFKPKFLRTYANLASTIKNAIDNYVNDVKSKKYPSENEQY